MPVRVAWLSKARGVLPTLIDDGVALLGIAGAHAPLSVNMWLGDWVGVWPAFGKNPREERNNNAAQPVHKCWLSLPAE